VRKVRSVVVDVEDDDVNLDDLEVFDGLDGDVELDETQVGTWTKVFTINLKQKSACEQKWFAKMESSRFQTLPT